VVENSEAKGIKHYLERLTHPVKKFNFKFTDVECKTRYDGKLELKYVLAIQLKEEDIPWLWDYFNCKSKHIVEDACKIVGVNFGDVIPFMRYIYVNGLRKEGYGGYIPKWFNEKITKNIEQIGPKRISTNFFCGGERKNLILNVSYEVSDIYIDDGITTDVSVYCSEALIDGEPLENIPQDLAETIVGYVSEDDNIRSPLDDIVWSEITKYMNLEECEMWTHTYAYFRNIGNIQIDDFNYTSHSTFSSKLCDFISGDY